MKHSILDRPRVPEFGTLRLTCQPVLVEDAHFYGELFSRPEIQEFCTGPKDTKADVAHWARHGFGRWCLRHAGERVGVGGLTVKTGFAGLKLSYHLLPEFWGQGLASEFVRASLDFAQTDLDSDEVYGLVAPGNIASIRVLEKAGFRDAGLHMGENGPLRELRAAL